MKHRNWRDDASSQLLEYRLSNDALADLLADKPESLGRERPVIELRRCPLNRNAWAPKGSYEAGRCLCCNVPFADAA